MFDVNGWELVIIVVVALLVIGPERLPQYVARLREWIRDLKRLADGARSQLRDQMGPEFDDIDWSAYDPRQYDPRRIVRDALTETWNGADPNPEEGQAASGDGPQSADAGAAGASATGATIAAGAPYLDSSKVADRGAKSAAGEPRDRLVTPRYDLVHDPALPVPYDTEAT